MCGMPLRVFLQEGFRQGEVWKLGKGRKIDEENEKNRMPIFTVVCAYAALCLCGSPSNRSSGGVQIIYRLETGWKILVFL